MINKFFEWLFEEHPIVFDLLVFMVIVTLAIWVDGLIVDWFFS